MKKILSSIGAILLLNVFVVQAMAADAVNCKPIGERIAKQQGGDLKSATAIVENGKNMCLVVVLVPARGDEKPRRVEMAVPIK